MSIARQFEPYRISGAAPNATNPGVGAAPGIALAVPR